MVDRLGEQVALGALAPELPEQIQLVLCFDALRNYLKTQMVGKHYDDSNDFMCLGVAVHTGNKCPVDLQSVDSETLQSAERGVASAEVVDIQPNPECF